MGGVCRYIGVATGQSCRVVAAWALAVMAALGLVAGSGCATPPKVMPAAKPAAVAQMTVTNESPYAWRVTFRAKGGGETRVHDFAARQSATVAVPAGEVEIEQALVSAAVVREARRRVLMVLEANEHYDWTLATLLTDGEAVAPAAERR